MLTGFSFADDVLLGTFSLPGLTCDNSALVEAAYQINQEAKRHALTLWWKIMFVADDLEYTLKCIQVLFSVSLNANKIFPGTVKGFILDINGFQNSTEYKVASEILTSAIAVNISSAGLLLGTSQSCSTTLSFNHTNILAEIKNIIKHSDVIMCWDRVGTWLGATLSFQYLSNNLTSFKAIATKINPDIELIGSSWWHSNGTEPYDNPTEFRTYWEEANKWASANKILFIMDEAFDRDYGLGFGHMGAWKLRDGSVIDSMDSFEDKLGTPLLTGIKSNKIT